MNINDLKCINSVVWDKVSGRSETANWWTWKYAFEKTSILFNFCYVFYTNWLNAVTYADFGFGEWNTKSMLVTDIGLYWWQVLDVSS